MKIAIIGPGIMPIPPTGWGAVEILIWDQKVALEKLGHEVKIVNTPHPMDILKGLMSLVLILFIFSMMISLRFILIYNIHVLLPVILDIWNNLINGITIEIELLYLLTG